MNNDIDLKNEKQIDYAVVKQIEMHAKKYYESTNKKEFLKNVCAYEQKLILLNSEKPYEVLSYLDALDLKSSRLVINELKYEEILKILELFTSENKKEFYTTFSDLSMVNQFIMHDKNSSNYIKNLSFDRKVKLMDSSTKETIQASSKVYESMSYTEKEVVVESIESPEASVALNEITSNEVSLAESNDVLINDTEVENAELLNSQNEYVNEDKEIEENHGSKDLENIELFEDKIDFLKSNIQRYVDKFPELANINLEDKDIYSALSSELKEIIDNDYDLTNEKADNLNELKEDSEMEKGNQENSNHEVEFFEKYSIIGNGSSYASIISNPNVSDQFQQAKKECEKLEIEKFPNESINNIEGIIKTM